MELRELGRRLRYDLGQVDALKATASHALTTRCSGDISMRNVGPLVGDFANLAVRSCVVFGDLCIDVVHTLPSVVVNLMRAEQPN